ncbi:RelA/SpoT domain-containing protein [Dyella sp. 2RAB6]|uniref:RelA/SpoT domain-containing protein n=1 Tax=Dyella sp. 2RAB6 TaxID=3232992 RepID=UPI003F9240F4
MAAHVVFDNWRSAHAYPLNTFQVTLRARAQRIDRNALTAQRLKRAPSIMAKLQRFAAMDLARMQDIGGCRAILQDVEAVYALRAAFNDSRARHVLESTDDYIVAPKDDGYRGIHLVYKYVGRGTKTAYNGLRIEVQLRTKIQHAWATAVETVGLFRREAIKAGEGDPRWREFFKIASNAFARLEEHDLHVTAEHQRLALQLQAQVDELEVLNRLAHYSEALRFVQEAGQTGEASMYLLELDLDEDELSVRSFRDSERSRAQEAYAAAEERLGDRGDVVLVTVENVMALRKAYPNYFADTTLFLEVLEATLRWDYLYIAPELPFPPLTSAPMLPVVRDEWWPKGIPSKVRRKRRRLR